MSLANIALHYLILPISFTINQSVLFKRFIDDIIWLSYGLDTTTKIKQALICEFQKYDLKLSFRDINTSENNACIVFLDVEHKIDSFSELIRLRRLNESQSAYLKSLECLRKNVSNLISKPKLLKKLFHSPPLGPIGLNQTKHQSSAGARPAEAPPGKLYVGPFIRKQSEP